LLPGNIGVRRMRTLANCSDLAETVIWIADLREFS
jgi:hypothetical protein